MSARVSGCASDIEPLPSSPTVRRGRHTTRRTPRACDPDAVFARLCLCPHAFSCCSRRPSRSSSPPEPQPPPKARKPRRLRSLPWSTSPEEEDTVAGAVSAPPLASANLGGYRYPDDGSVISFASALTGSRTGPGSAARAEASASLADVVLFGGEIRIGSVTLRADASATSSGSGGTVSASSLDGVVVLGEPVDAIPNLRVPLGDWGYLVLLEQAELRRSGADGPATGRSLPLFASS